MMSYLTVRIKYLIKWRSFQKEMMIYRSRLEETRWLKCIKGELIRVETKETRDSVEDKLTWESLKIQ